MIFTTPSFLTAVHCAPALLLLLLVGGMGHSFAADVLVVEGTGTVTIAGVAPATVPAGQVRMGNGRVAVAGALGVGVAPIGDVGLSIATPSATVPQMRLADSSALRYRADFKISTGLEIRATDVGVTPAVLTPVTLVGNEVRVNGGTPTAQVRRMTVFSNGGVRIGDSLASPGAKSLGVDGTISATGAIASAGTVTAAGSVNITQGTATVKVAPNATNDGVTFSTGANQNRADFKISTGLEIRATDAGVTPAVLTPVNLVGNEVRVNGGTPTAQVRRMTVFSDGGVRVGTSTTSPGAQSLGVDGAVNVTGAIASSSTVTATGSVNIKQGTATVKVAPNATNDGLILTTGANQTVVVLTLPNTGLTTGTGVVWNGTKWTTGAPTATAKPPAGAVMHFAQATAPNGWLVCNGQAVSRTTYAALFTAIGTTYGAGDGSTTFSLPDLRGEFIRGADVGRGVDAGRVVGSAQPPSFIRTITSNEAAYVGEIPPSGGWGIGVPYANFEMITGVPAGAKNSVGEAFPAGAEGNISTGGHVISYSYAMNRWGAIRPRNVALLPCIAY
jgi:hypothetical protein